jgi:RNA polymerase sigma-70 factor (ECF subfamily)
MEHIASIPEWRDSVEALFVADADRLWHAIYVFAGDHDVASDAVAETYAQLLRRGAGVRDLTAWTWRTSFRIAAGMMKLRRRDAELPTVPIEHLDRHADPDLLRALRQLPEAQRAAVTLYYYADLPAAEIANRLGSNPFAVRMNLSRGRRRLRELLGDSDD